MEWYRDGSKDREDEDYVAVIDLLFTPDPTPSNLSAICTGSASNLIVACEVSQSLCRSRALDLERYVDESGCLKRKRRLLYVRTTVVAMLTSQH